jgi:hypothetical protein
MNWARYKNCNVRWEELFVTPMDRYPLPLSSFQAGVDLYDDRINTDSFPQDMPLSLAGNKSAVVAVRSFQNFRPGEMTIEAFEASKSLFYRSLQPVETADKAVEEIQKRYFEGYTVVGIHIRRTDHLSFGKKDHKLVCPTDLFIEAMERILKADPGTKFFLSTDDKNEEKRIIQRFPGVVIVHEKEEVRRDTASGMQEALIDWLLLSKTSRIIGSYASSFSEEAAVVNGIKAEYVLRTEELSRLHYKAAVKSSLRDFFRAGKKLFRNYLKRPFKNHLVKPLAAYSLALYRVLNEEGLRKFFLYSFTYRKKAILSWMQKKIFRS